MQTLENKLKEVEEYCRRQEELRDIEFYNTKSYDAQAIKNFNKKTKKCGFDLKEIKYSIPEDKSRNLELLDNPLHELQVQAALLLDFNIENKNDYKNVMSIFIRVLNQYTSLNHEEKSELLTNYMYSSLSFGIYEYDLCDKYEQSLLLDSSKVQEHFKIIEEVLHEFTKNDTEVNRELLTNDEVTQALNNSISKFIELHQQQPQELKQVLINYEETPLVSYIYVIKIAINDSDDKRLEKLFKTYKRDEQHRVYNYDLFAFIYYAYSMHVSFKHVYDNPLLESLGAYRYDKDRQKPSLKTDVLKRLNDGKKIALLFQCETNIYIEKLIQFIKDAELKKINLYILSFLVDMSHNITVSKDLLDSITAKKNYHKVTYENLPRPVNTLLLPPKLVVN